MRHIPNLPRLPIWLLQIWLLQLHRTLIMILIRLKRIRLLLLTRTHILIKQMRRLTLLLQLARSEPGLHTHRRPRRRYRLSTRTIHSASARVGRRVRPPPRVTVRGRRGL